MSTVRSTSSLWESAPPAWLAWLVLLNAKGEEVRLRTLQFGRGDEERILLQLDSLNDTLLRASHK